MNYDQKYEFSQGAFFGPKGIVLLDMKPMTILNCESKCSGNTSCHSYEWHESEGRCIHYDAKNPMSNGHRDWESYNKIEVFEDPKLTTVMPESNIELDDFYLF